MLVAFDWLRRSENGAELIATMDAMESAPDLFRTENGVGEPFCGIRGPCIRCWLLPRLPGSSHCSVCHRIVTDSRRLGSDSKRCLLVWAFVNFLPNTVKQAARQDQRALLIKDDKHFLAAVSGPCLNAWLKKLLQDDKEQKGTLIVFPTTRKKSTFTMGDVLCRAIQHDASFPMDRLRIEFFSKPGQLKAPHLREQEGMLILQPYEFLPLLELATVFSTLLNHEEVEIIKYVMSIQDQNQKAFQWGRLMGILNLEARDMLVNMKTWPVNRIKWLCELAKYVRPSR